MYDYLIRHLIRHLIWSTTCEPRCEKTGLRDFCDLVPLKPDSTAIEDGERLEISDLGRGGIVLSV